ncbi:Transcriptional activator protein ExaE [Marinomonas spartinae]|uniref:Transcriptional activator protein ExaE n=1 Tax=Marinomonas spartinae TaxID=1792290 RepID=A0A1A8TKR7_9GAMM|nr:response regulator transcription factor [Marinomonas spartinae]SBS33567.1 Transcriptional activator protein ExaE [Marinomonas spartinae]SBS39220.1 Transcriptional activator protein ExaE [Marinomonas spartinae]
MISLIIADDHPLFRSALSGALRAEINGITIEEADDLDSTLRCLSEMKEVDLLLLDLKMPGSGELFGLIRIRTDFPDVPVAVISGSDEGAMVAQVIEAGALGFIPKTSEPSVYSRAIHAILAGDIWLPDYLQSALQDQPTPDLSMQHRVAELTPQQYKVLCYLHEGLLNKQIAHELSISEATVKAHITAIFRKLDINNRTQAVLVASELKLQM